MSEQIQISVIIPAYNAEKFLAAAIESVLSQTIQPSEIFVVNDGSTDRTEDVARSFPNDVILINQENRGISGARNSAIKRATGSILAFLDADDIWPSNHIELLLNELQLDPELDMVFGYVEQFINPEDQENAANEITQDRKVMPGNVAGASLIKRDAFDRVGHFNEELTLAEFVDWFSRANDEGLSHKMISDVVLKRRIHSDNIGKREKSQIKDYTKVLMASIRRKRAKE